MITKNMDKTIKKIIYKDGGEAIAGIGYFEGYVVIQSDKEVFCREIRDGVLPEGMKVQTVRGINRTHYQKLANIASEKARLIKDEEDLKAQLTKVKHKRNDLNIMANEASKHIKDEEVLRLMKEGVMELGYFSRSLKSEIDKMDPNIRVSSIGRIDNVPVTYELILSLDADKPITSYAGINFIDNGDGYEQYGFAEEYGSQHFVKYRLTPNSDKVRSSIEDFSKVVKDHLNTNILDIELFAELGYRNAYGGILIHIERNKDGFELEEAKRVLKLISEIRVEDLSPKY